VNRRQAALDWFSDRLNTTEFLSLLSGFGLIYVELDNRLPPRRALARALSRPLASYARWPRVLGLSVIVLVAFEILTGALLALYYLPTPATAYESVALIQRDVEFGALVHQVHYWGAQLLIFALMIRLVRYLAHGLYQSPREIEWLVASSLLAVAVVADLSGRLLPWTDDGYWFGVRLVEVLAGVPLIGPMVGFLLGGEGTFLSELTLIRVYGLHAAAVPFVLLLLIYLHFSSVRRLGLNELPRETKLSGASVLRRHLAEVAMVAVIAVTVLITLALLWPQSFPPAADPYTTLPTVRLPWYLLAATGLSWLSGGVLTPAAAGGLLLLPAAALLLLPFVGRAAIGRPQRLTLAAVLAFAWVALTTLGLVVGR
jgi:quinol-cytochrome oxidoreductase complex cytochrome b subunit